MNAKRTCGECEHYPRTTSMLGICAVGLPMWVELDLEEEPYRIVRRDRDATHCETFTLKQPRKDDE